MNGGRRRIGGRRISVSVYLPIEILEEVEVEAGRQDRSKSWLLEQAWKLAKLKIESFKETT